MKNTNIISILIIVGSLYALGVYGLILIALVFWLIPQGIRNNPLGTMKKNINPGRQPRRKKTSR